MLRLFFFLVQLAVLVGASLWLVNQTGDVAIEAFGNEFRLNAGLAIIALIIVVWLVIQGYNLVTNFLNLGERAKRKRAEAHNRKGIEAITRGLSAIAAGDTQEAARQQRKAEKHLKTSPLTHLIGAQTALLEGDSEKASDKFTAMLEDKEAAFMGLRGLINQAMQSGDRAETFELLRQAYKLRPKTQCCRWSPIEAQEFELFEVCL